MYDPVCKFLVENFSADFANWLLGESISFSILSPSELSLEPIRADSVILLESEQQPGQTSLLHLEFQTYPEAKIPFRMLDYWVRIYRINPQKQIRQIVIYLSRSQSELVYQSQFQSTNTTHQFEVVRLWEQPFETFLGSPGLLPFAALSQVEDPAVALEQVATQIREIDPRSRQSIGASAAILAGLVLEDESLVQRIIGMELLEQSSVYQSIKQQGIQQGIQQGVQQGIQQSTQRERSLALRLLNMKLGEIPSSLEDRVNELQITQLERLIEALLGFSAIAELEAWLTETEQESDSDAAEQSIG